MADKKFSQFTAGSTNQVPTDELVGLDLSLSVANQNTRWTLNNLFSTITRNITDGALRFGGFAAPAVSGAGAGAIYFDSASNLFRVSVNGGAYTNLGDLTGSFGATGQVAYASASKVLTGSAGLTFDAATSALTLGTSALPGGLRLVGTSGTYWNVASQNPAANKTLYLPNSTTPTTGNFLFVGNAGVQTQTDWSTGLTWSNSTNQLTVTASNNNQIGFAVQNTSAGTAAESVLGFTANGGAISLLSLTGTGFTTAGLYRANQLYWRGTTGITEMLFALDDASTAFKFGVNNAVAASINATATEGLVLGIASSLTGRIKLFNSAGATYTQLSAGNAASSLNYILPATAPTAGQVLTAAAPSGSNVTLSWGAGGGGGAPTTSQYVLLAADGALPNARVIGVAAGGGITETIGAGTYTLAVDQTNAFNPTIAGQYTFNRGNTPSESLLLDVNAPGAGLIRESSFVRFRARMNDGTPHTVDFQAMAGAVSTDGQGGYWRLRQRIDTGAYADVFRVEQGGVISVGQLAALSQLPVITDARLLGRSAGSSGTPQEVTIGGGLSLNAGVLSANGLPAALDGLIGASLNTANVIALGNKIANRPSLNILTDAAETSIIWDGGLWHVWFRRVSNNNIFYATTTNPSLSNWTLGNGGAPVLLGHQYPYVRQEGATFYLYAVKISDGQLYLYTSTDKTTWTVANGGLPVITRSATPSDWNFNYYNCAVEKVGSTYHMLIEGAANGGVFKLGYAVASAPNGPFVPSAAPIVSGTAGNPDLHYDALNNRLWALYGERDDGFTGKWRIRACYASASSNLNLAANWTTREVLAEAGEDYADPDLVFTAGIPGQTWPSILSYGIRQLDCANAYSLMTEQEWSDWLAAGATNEAGSLTVNGSIFGNKITATSQVINTVLLKRTGTLGTETLNVRNMFDTAYRGLNTGNFSAFGFYVGYTAGGVAKFYGDPANSWQLAADMQLTFNSNSNLFSGSADIGLARRAAGTLRVSNGSTGAGNLLLGTSTIGAIGTNGVGVLALANGTSPTTFPADTNQIVARDSAAGDSNLIAFNEAGQETRLTGVVKILDQNFARNVDTRANVAGSNANGSLSFNVEAGKRYTFKAVLHVDADVTGGVSIGLGGTATATSFIAQFCSWNNGSGANAGITRLTSFGGGTGFAGVTDLGVVIEGSIVVNAAGTINVQFGQNTASGTSTVLAGSSFTIAQA